MTEEGETQGEGGYESSGMPSADERNLAMIAHLGGVLASIIPSLLVWLLKKDESDFLEDQGRDRLALPGSQAEVPEVGVRGTHGHPGDVGDGLAGDAEIQRLWP